MDKLMKWKLIENELWQAHQLLPKNIKQSDFGYREVDFLEYLSHNELRLAMEELDGVIVDNPSPSKEFWQHLVNAANLMNSKKEPTYKQFIDAT
ncbi:hypothetical protein ACZ81_10945 [Alteromonas macleodii]|jgi:hypothetical protein|uniref:hypothetical protein n=1 Tax=Alteromonas macleodii TaxID=28108 RepID=UPI000777E9A6|nr:hypothetical protein [Alteromonas macleodii]AMN12057.1 hypothetical protein ACZ81_10945 [Alteromonas macleodii]AUI82766.1 hypothetical protein TE101_10890 [Alteromonas macleodii]RUM31130.1 MAG: hypothetical protein DSY75_04525 [Alteromonas sp.]|tara:strand:+ start:207 stop:488 length:282 start_codon:yes stop_codon:yes gene_type:complete